MITIYALVWCHTLNSLGRPAQACLGYGGQPTFSSIEQCRAYAAPLRQRIAVRASKNAALTVECIARDIPGMKATELTKSSGPKAKNETAGGEQPSERKVEPLAIHPDGLSGSPAVAKTESISLSATGRNSPPSAHAHPKQEKATKVRNTAQAAVDAPHASADPATPAQPPEPAAPPNNSLLRALGDALGVRSQ